MEKVFDLHVHYSFEIPLRETIEIFQEEFVRTGTDKMSFASLPHHEHNGKVDYDEMQNLKGLCLKDAFSPNAYAFAGLVHPQVYADKQAIAQDFVKQAQEYLQVGYDGIKMLEGYPSLVKARNLPVDSEIFDKFYAFMEEKGFPILMHIANPEENWDREKASPQAIADGRVYDESYPTKEELTSQVFRVMQKFPRLKLILAHFGFMSYDMAQAERFLSYENTYLDITPGGEQLLNMAKEWSNWLPFWEKHQDKILYGTDFYAFPKDESWEVAFQRRPKLIRQFLETNGCYEYLEEPFQGIALEKKLRDKIYRKNFEKLLGEPSKIDKNYVVRTAKQLLKIPNKKSIYAQEDLTYILGEYEKNY